MRRVGATFLKAGANARSFASSTGVEPAGSWLETVSKTGSGLVAIVAAVGAVGYWVHTVDAKFATMSTKVDERLVGVEKSVDAKVAGVKESVSKEVAGVEKSVDAKVAGVSDKAKAEALMVLKEYGVSIAGGLASK